MPSSRGELATIHPKFAEDSPARCRDKKEGDPIVGLTDYVYSAEDNKAVEDWTRQNVSLSADCGSFCVTEIFIFRFARAGTVCPLAR